MYECKLIKLIKNISEDKRFENDLKCTISKLNDLYKKQIKFEDLTEGDKFNLYLCYLNTTKIQRYDIFNIFLMILPLSATIFIGFLSLSYTKFQKILCQYFIEDLFIKVAAIASIVLTIIYITLLAKLNIDCHKYDDTEFIKYIINRYYEE